jgi:prepilin-type N-terminal cleavage/methylation domain-containing protein
MRSLSQARVGQRGFTLAELLVVIAIIGLIMTGLLTLLQKGNESYLAGANQVETQAATRATLERMTQEIREAGYNPTGVVCVPPAGPGCAIVNATPTSFMIQNDWDGNGAINPAIAVCVPYSWAACPNPGGTNNRGEQITYSIVVGGTLCRQESFVDPPATPPCPAGQPLVTSVAQASVGGVLQPFFQYLDANGNVAATVDQIRTVVVILQVGVQNQPPAVWQTGAIQVAMMDRIRLRNRIP